MYLFYFFITANTIIGYYELIYAYIRESLTLLFLHIP